MYKHLFLVFTAPIVLLVTGCGPKPTYDETRDGGAGERTRVRFLAMEYDTNTRPFMKDFEEEFERENPDIDLQIEVVDWDSGHQKLTTLVNADNPPDLANIATLWIAEYTDLDALEPLDDHISADFLARFDPLTLHGTRHEGKLYGLPIAVSARALYCNMDIMAKAGVTPPQTWDELVSAARACTDPQAGVYGIGIQGAKVETDVYWYYFLWNNGGEILSEDLKQPLFNGPEGVEALQFVVDLVHRHSITQPDPTAYNREGLQDLFKAGKLAMVITGPWFWNMLDNEAPDLNYKIVPIPTRGEQVTMAVTDNLVLFKGAQDKTAVVRVLEHFYRDELRARWAQTFHMLPELTAVQQAEFVRESSQWSALMYLLPTGRFVPLHPRWTAIADEITVGVQEALLKRKDPKTALDDAAKRVENLL